jgi:PKD repeat protein
LGNDTLSCGLPIIIGSTLPVTYTYQWNATSYAPTFTATSTGSVYLKGTDPNTGCFRMDTLLATLDTVSVWVGNDTTVCDSFRMLAQTNRSGYLLNWNPAAPAQLGRTVYQTGSYYLRATNPVTGCSAIDSAYHVVYSTPKFFLRNDTFICSNDSLVLNPNVSAFGLTRSNGNPTLRNVIRSSGNYYLTATNGQCGFTDSILVTVSAGVSANFVSSYNGLTAFVVANSYPNARYFWDFGDGNTGTGQNTSHAYAQSGYYQIRLIVTDSCDVDTITKPLLIIAQGTTSLSDQWVVYPNPANDEIWLATNGMIRGEIKLFDATGRMVQNPRIELQESKVKISSQNLSNGIYWIEWKNNKERKSTKVVIQH